MALSEVTEATVAQAYELGRNQIRQRQPLGGDPRSQYFALPASISIASGGDWLDDAPTYGALSDTDRKAMRILYESIIDFESPEVRYAGLMGEILSLRDIMKLDYSKSITCDPNIWTDYQNKSLRYLRKNLLRIVNYVRKKSMSKSEQKKGFVSAKEATGVGDLHWLAKSRDPDLWHLIAAHANTDLLEKFVVWVIQQPECDRATAAYLFLKLGGVSCFDDPPSGSPSSWSFAKQSVARICNRSENGDGFLRRVLTLSEVGEKDDQRDLLLNIQAKAGRAESFAPVPVRLLGEVFEGRATNSAYELVGEGEIVDAM
jgi:hypothetical protein